MTRLLFTCFFITCTLHRLVAEVSYTLSFEQARQHYVHVKMEFEHSGNGRIKMPAWSPGSYLIRDYAAHVENVVMQTPEGTKIPLTKADKHTWLLPATADKLHVEYDVYAHDLSVRTSHVTEQHAFIHSPSVLMYVPQLIGSLHHLSVQLPVSYTHITSALDFKGNEILQATALNYDELADSPLEIGTHDTLMFEVKGVRHDVAIYGTGFYNKSILRKDLQKICETAVGIYGVLPCKKYAFIIHATSTPSGGLEHANSSALQVGLFDLAGEPMYGKFLNLAAHEYFHLWNIKRFRPLELGPFDYEKENHSSHLWLVEGFTSYYASKILLYAGYLSQEQFLSYVASQVAYLLNAPGAGTRSVAQSSFDAWILAYKPTENSTNTSTSYYNHGSALAAALDVLLAGQGKYNLDRLMAEWYRTLYVNQPNGYTDEDLIATALKLTGIDLSTFFADHVHGTKPPYFQSLFEAVGYRLETNVDRSASLGITLSGTTVTRVQRHSAAWQAGISPKDEILAINGLRIRNEVSIANIISLLPTGSKINVLLSRDEKMMEVLLATAPSATVQVQLKLLAGSTSSQAKKALLWITQK